MEGVGSYSHALSLPGLLRGESGSLPIEAMLDIDVLIRRSNREARLPFFVVLCVSLLESAVSSELLLMFRCRVPVVGEMGDVGDRGWLVSFAAGLLMSLRDIRRPNDRHAPSIDCRRPLVTDSLSALSETGERGELRSGAELDVSSKDGETTVRKACRLENFDPSSASGDLT